MELGHVGAGNFAGMIFALCVSVGIPFIMLAIVCKKTHVRASIFFIGGATFFVSALVLEQILHSVVFAVSGDVITGNIWLYGLYGGLAAGLFEETGRWVTMRYVMKGKLSLPGAMVYGIGHGGVEAILIVGMTSVNNLLTAFMINSGAIEGTLSQLDEATRSATVDQLSALWTLPSYQFFLGGVERIFAMVLHFALSVIVYQAVRQEKKSYWLLAFGIHAFVDFITVVTANYWNILFVELLLVAMVAGAVWLAVALSKRNAPAEAEQQ